MSTDTITATYRSEPRIYGVLNEPIVEVQSIGCLTVREIFEPNANEHIRSGLGSYTIVMEARITAEPEFSAFQREAFDLAQCLDRLWTYATGMPLSVNYQGRAIYAYEYLHPPRGWSSNLEEVNKQLKAKAEYSIKVVSSKNIMWQWLPSLPLKTVLHGRAKYLATSDSTHSLIEQHYDAQIASNSHSRLFSLAKGLEIVRAMLPGKSNWEKQSALDSEVASTLKIGLHDLFKIGNNRREIRHIVKDPRSKELHPKMTSQESDAFCHDADVIIRFVVAKELGMPIIVVGNESSPLSARE